MYAIRPFRVLPGRLESRCGPTNRLAWCLLKFFRQAAEEPLTVEMLIELEPVGTGTAGTIHLPSQTPDEIAPARRSL